MRISRLSFIFGVSAILVVCLSSKARAQEVSGYTTIFAVELKQMQDSGKEILVIDTLAISRHKAGYPVEK